MKTAAYIALAIAIAFGVYWFFFRKKETAAPSTDVEKRSTDDATKIAAFARADLLAAQQQNLQQFGVPANAVLTQTSVPGFNLN